MHVDVKECEGQNSDLETLLGKFLVCGDIPLNNTCDCLPPK